MNDVLENFPENIRKQLEEYNFFNIEEIRIRINNPVIIKISNNEIIFKNYKVSREDISFIMQKICDNSIYSYQRQISEGFITVKGGHRVGIVGSAVIEDSKVINLNYISSLNFRISHEIKYCSKDLLNEIVDLNTNQVFNTLIVSPPGLGKTTLLRDIIKNISNGFNEFKGVNVTVIDERGEISSSYKGISQNDLGIRTDILNNMPKCIGMKMAIRSMSPKVIACDEIGLKEDAKMIKNAICCGVSGIFTSHGNNFSDLLKNEELKDLIDSKVFEKIIILKNRINSNYDKLVYLLDENNKYILKNNGSKNSFNEYILYNKDFKIKEFKNQKSF